MSLFKIYLSGRDFVDWATDEDYFLLKDLLEGQVELVNCPEDANIIHSINWTTLRKISRSTLSDKFVVAQVPHDPNMMFQNPLLANIRPLVDKWLVPSKTAKGKLSRYGIESVFIPYIPNRSFCRLADSERQYLRTKYGLPQDKVLIGSFQRDTEGANLRSPKLVKGPDIFLEIVKRLDNVHIVLAGPRRQWIRGQLELMEIPYSYIGQIVENDQVDLKVNNLDITKINELYNSIDLYIVSSRLEGGPKAITECILTKTPIISTEVGHADDLLNKEQIYSSIDEGIKKANYAIFNKQIVEYTEFDSENSLRAILSRLYSEALSNTQNNLTKSRNRSYLRKIGSMWYSHSESVATMYKTRKGPWGGANQFLKLLFKRLKESGFHLNGRRSSTILVNSFHEISKYQGLPLKMKHVVHRIDGPTFLIRGTDKDLDDRLFEFNGKYANVSIFQSHWSLSETIKLGYSPVNPIVIHNAADPEIFHSKWKTHSLPKNLNHVSIVGSSWSSNPRKGRDTYRWLDSNLDFSKVSLTFIGNIDGQFENINVVPPLHSEDLAAELCQHDVYLAPSVNDPCSNALIEALSIGLPAVFKLSGGHPELVGWGGLGFEEPDELPLIFEKIAFNYSSFVNLINPPSPKKVVDSYLEILTSRAD